MTSSQKTRRDHPAAGWRAGARRRTLGALLLLAATAFAADIGPQPGRQLWFYYSTNLQVDQNVTKLEPIWRRAAAAGYTHVMLADSKFARLGDLGSMTEVYFRNIARVRALAAELKLTLVPALFPVGYSNCLLWHNPSLAEGLPVKDQPFVVRDGRLAPANEPPVTLAKIAWKDDCVSLASNTATVVNPPGNARFVYSLAVPRFRCYHVTVSIRTRDFSGQPQIVALADGESLQHQNLGVQATQDWHEHHVVFNTLDHAKVGLYFGAWGGGRGRLEWRDWRIEEAAFVNVLRRPGAPVSIAGAREGEAVARIEDPLLGNRPWKGEYQSWHEPPVIRATLPEGTRLTASWYHPAIIYDGQVSACLSEPQTLELLADQARRVQAAWQAPAYMMSHDELRTLNWDAACTNRGLSAGRILADNARACTRLLEGATVHVWSDMFDPHHNAHSNYYLVRGDLAGSWEGLDRSVVIVNWNFGKRAESLRFFAGRGHRQLIAGYYDGPVEQVKEWLKAAEGVTGITGVMYTTWENHYDDLEAFARACRK